MAGEPLDVGDDGFAHAKDADQDKGYEEQQYGVGMGGGCADEVAGRDHECASEGAGGDAQDDCYAKLQPMASKIGGDPGFERAALAGMASIGFARHGAPPFRFR